MMHVTKAIMQPRRAGRDTLNERSSGPKAWLCVIESSDLLAFSKAQRRWIVKAVRINASLKRKFWQLGMFYNKPLLRTTLRTPILMQRHTQRAAELFR